MSRNTYSFSRARALIHIFLLLFTAGGWLLIAVPWELYRYFGKN